jgi:hypothetical protein
MSPEDVADHIAEAVLRILGAPRTPAPSTSGNGKATARGRRRTTATVGKQQKAL